MRAAKLLRIVLCSGVHGYADSADKYMCPIDNIKKRIFKTLWPFGSLCYSQEGEDMMLSQMFFGQKSGFYVDVGAHHPLRFSNTYLFYLRGWNGINIDAMPGSMAAFNEKRPRDINLEIPVSDKSEELTYYIFNEPALNGFSKELSMSRDGLRGQYKIIETKALKTRTLCDILDEYIPDDKHIDFLSIDVEGLDFQVLSSNNWGRYRPSVVVVEVLSNSIDDLPLSKTYRFMQENGYVCYAKTDRSTFFLENEFYKNRYGK